MASTTIDPSAPADPDGGAPGQTVAWAYRPYLDGLRALAVYLVVAFHAGADRLSGGFIGVDVFFVLSGYLVTSLLLRDLDAGGRIRLGRFYSRRIRRLLPAAGVNLVVTALVFRAIAAPAEFAKATGAIRAAALYVSNWWFIRESTDYFGTDVAASPVAHYWSLSVEEQFYLAWPLLLGALVLVAGAAGRHRRAALTALVGVLGVASLALALVTAAHHPDRAYFGTDTRAYQLLAGAVLALVPSLVERLRRSDRAEAALGAVGLLLAGALLVLGTTALHVGPVTRGALAAAATAGLIVALEAARGGPARRLLASGGELPGPHLLRHVPVALDRDRGDPAPARPRPAPRWRWPPRWPPPSPPSATRCWSGRSAVRRPSIAGGPS
ncbi:MAG: acyltransferase [Acidimicrobiales bacterium]